MASQPFWRPPRRDPDEHDAMLAGQPVDDDACDDCDDRESDPSP